MKVAALQEDLQFIEQVLQEQLRAEIPSGELFQVKCVAKNNQLMILAQHPQDISIDTENILAVLEETLQSLPTNCEQQVEIFLRITGVKLPYAKSSLTLKAFRTEEVGVKEDIQTQEYEDAESLSSSEPLPVFESSSLSVYNHNEQFESSYDESQEEPFDPMAGARDVSSLKLKRVIKNTVLGVFAVTIPVLGGGAYFLTRPCVTSECKEIQTAEKLRNSFQKMISSAKSEQELAKVQQQLLTASAALQEIPPWSPHHQESEKLITNLSKRSEIIAQVIKAFGTASSAAKKSKIQANSLEELKARQHLWRQAIAPLETTNTYKEFYGLVQPKLAASRTKLQAVNQQLLSEEKWLQQIAAAKDAANAATQHEITVKSLQDLQKVQSTWQMAVNALSRVPQTSLVYPEAQELLTEYKPKLILARDRATKQLLAAKIYRQAVTAAQQAKDKEKQNQWQAAVAHWKQAVSAAKQVAQDSFYYNQAQTLIEPHSTALKQAQEKLQVAISLQQTRSDLEKTCFNTIRICAFTINNQEIIVRITHEYEKALNIRLGTAQNGSEHKAVAIVTNHLQILQQALEVISDNANLPVIVFDAQGNQIHGHLPRG